MYALGMPNAILWGVLAGVFNFVPYLGPDRGVFHLRVRRAGDLRRSRRTRSPCPACSSLASHRGATRAAAHGRTPLEVNALVVLLAVWFGYGFWGIPGMLLATPVLVALKVAAQLPARLARRCATSSRPIGHWHPQLAEARCANADDDDQWPSEPDRSQRLRRRPPNGSPRMTTIWRVRQAPRLTDRVRRRHHPHNLAVAALVLAIGANLATTEKRLLYRPRRLYTSGDADFRRALGILLGPPLVPGNRITTLVNGAQIYPAMLERDPHGADQHHLRDLRVPRRHRRHFRRGARRTAARRGVQVHMLLDWLGSRTMDQQPARGGARGGLRGAALSPALLVSPRPAQQPHAPQAAGRRRQDRLHRRRRHGHRMERRPAGPAAVARNAFQGRRPGRRADAGGVRRQLDQGHGPRAARRRVLSRSSPACRRHGRADVRQLAGRRFREHASHGAAGADRREDLDRHRERLLRAGQAHGRGAVLGGAARRARAHRGARAVTPTRASAAGRRRDCTARCSKPASRSTNTSRR